MYKRGSDDLESLKSYCIYLASFKDAYMNLGGDLNITKPYNGLYIVKNKMYVENVIEKIQIDHQSYRVGNFKTLSTSVSSDEFLEVADTHNLYFEYKVANVSLAKKIRFLNDSNILCIEYFVENDNDKKAIVKVIPMVTYKDVLAFKKSSELNFNKFNINNGLRIDLSVAQNSSVILKSDYAEFKEIDSFLNNVVHELNLENGKKEIVTEDLYIPGEFDIKLEPKTEKIFRVFISTIDFDIEECINNSKLKPRMLPKVQDEFVELKKLVLAKINFDNDYLTSSIPSYIDLNKFSNLTNDNISFVISELIKIVNSLEGQYLIFKENIKAENKLKQVLDIIKILDKLPNLLNDNYELYLLKLWCVHMLYNIYIIDKTIAFRFESFLKKQINDINRLFKIDSDHFKKLEFVCLSFNLFKIYETMYSNIIYKEIENGIKEKINLNFYSDREKVLKYDLDENEIYATAEMIYALSLSFQIVDLDIGIKILDTVFKELYTPYGLRKYSKLSSKNKGLIYPKYMAHFVKANLIQNGNTFASKKIVYNLVKELLQDIDKQVLNSCKCVYHEKGLVVDKNSLDLLTTAEMIRLYNMLT